MEEYDELLDPEIPEEEEETGADEEIYVEKEPRPLFKSAVPKTTVLNPPSPVESDMPSGKDIASTVSELINANIFGETQPNESVSKIITETVENADRLRQEFESKLKNIPLNKTEDYILNGQLYGDLAGKALDANNQRIGVLNSLAKYIPKANPKSQVNVAQQMNNQNTHNGVTPEQFMQVIKLTEEKGMNPVSTIRDAEESASQMMQDEHEDESDEEGDGTDLNPNEQIIFSPKVDDFGA